MITKKEFYFVRHGQTDYNLHKLKVDHGDVSLNRTGVQQAHSIESVIASLPIKTVCCSPLKRAKETKEIVTRRITADHYEVVNLGECTTEVWFDMSKAGVHAYCCELLHVRNFMDRALDGINTALALEGPVLIVAHGGIHWALCCLTGIEGHDWSIDNCVPVHFTLDAHGRWKARKLV